jgi:hypothetical protein
MAQPYPPQGNQQQHTERPLKVYAEQYLEGGALPIGVMHTAPTGEETPPYLVDAAGRYQPVRSTDWVISNRYTGAPIEVISDEEMSERFVSGGGPPVPGA